MISLNTPIDSSDIVRAIKIMVELFRAISRAPKKSVQGLWAELYLMARSKNPEVLLEAWHIQPEDLYDFNLGDQRIEVKSTSQHTRRHHFSLAQLQPRLGVDVLIASMFIERTQSGQSLQELIDRIQDCINSNPELLVRLDQVVSLTLGNSLKHALNERFDNKLAEKSLKFFEASSIPSINSKIPPEVSDIHFVSDLSNSSPVDIALFREKGGVLSFL